MLSIPKPAIPIPDRMSHLPTDKRGLPIPYNIWWDDAGTPRFAINDTEKARKCLAENLCPVCGGHLFDHEEDRSRGMWFVGGPLSALLPNGAYLDQPMHDECVHYALRVCPYMAAPAYGKTVGMAVAKGVVEKDLATGVSGFNDPTPLNKRPDLFVAVQAHSYTARKAGLEVFLRPIRPYIAVEYWLNGDPITGREAHAIMTLSEES